MTTLSTDARLVADYLGGDSSALAAIYDRYAPGLYDTAAAMLSDRHDAADMVQDVFCIAAERLSQLREPDRLKPWLYSVLRHEVYRRTKKRKRAAPVDFQDERTPDVAGGYDPHAAGEAVAYEELAALVRSAASGLDERDRLVLELSVRQGLSGAELADALGVTPDQSYSLVHRMRERVEKSLGALTVAKAGRRDCAQLDLILADWNGEFTVLLRKRVNRHIEECDTCDRNRKKFAPLALFGAAPAFVLPLDLRDKVLAAAGSVSGTGTSTSSHVRFDARRGFPRASRAGRHAATWIASAVVVAGIGIGGALLATSDDDVGTVGAVTSIVVRPVDTTAAATALSPAAPADSTTAPMVPPARPATPTTNASVAPASPTIAPVDPTIGSTTTTSTTAPSTTAVPIVLAVQMSSTTLNLGTNGSTIGVTLRNPNPFPVTYSSTLTSGRFTTTPGTGTLSAGQQVSLVVAFDRSGAVADVENFPTGWFAHTLTVTTTADGGASSPTRSATLIGSIERVATTTTTAAPAIRITVGKVVGTAVQCSTLGLRAVVTTNGRIAPKTVIGEAQFLDANGKSIRLATGLTMALGTDGYWRTSTALPAGTAKVLLTVTAETTTGQRAQGTGSLSTAC